MMEKFTVEECRKILGDTTATDAAIEATRDELERVANSMYDVMTGKPEREPSEDAQDGALTGFSVPSQSISEDLRWAAYAQGNPEDAA